MLTREVLIKILLSSGADVEEGGIFFDKTFKENGLDSLDVFNFLTEIENELGVGISDDDFENIKTMSDLYNYLASS